MESTNRSLTAALPGPNLFFMPSSVPTPRGPGIAQEASGSDERATDAALTLDEVYDRFAPYVAAIATRILGREAEVQDVVHDVFAAAVSGLRYRGNVHQVRSWLAKVTVRSSVRQLRTRKLRSLFEWDRETTEYDMLADPGASPEDKELIRELYTVLDQLPSRNRVAWTLRYVEGEQLEDVAEMCGCSLATAKRRIAAAHEQVQRFMGDRQR